MQLPSLALAIRLPVGALLRRSSALRRVTKDMPCPGKFGELTSFSVVSRLNKGLLTRVRVRPDALPAHKLGRNPALFGEVGEGGGAKQALCELV